MTGAMQTNRRMFSAGDQHGLLAEFRAMTRASELRADGDERGCVVCERDF